MLDAINFALWIVYLDNRSWFDWAAIHIGMITEAWAGSIEKRMLASGVRQ